MPLVIVHSKLAIPVLRSQMVPRPRALEALVQVREAKLTLVSAPTGWGKTSLLAEWVAGGGGPVAWVSLDPGDNDPLRFWRYVVAALASIEPALAATAERRLGAPVVSIGEEILPVLVNDLAELRGPLVLVLDDYHMITDPEIHEQLGYLLSRLPLNMHLVVSAQADPPLRLGRLRAMGDLAEVRGEQLRFSDEEAALLLNEVHGLDLDATEIATVQARIEGWVAGLNLAALSLKRGPDRGRVLDALPADDRFLVDYLWNEVVLAQPRSVRHFLMRTAILERLTGDLCDAVSERDDGKEMLRELERVNMFVVPLDPDRSWFRYHHLFRSLLLGQLERFAPDLIDDLHRRASTWYAAHDFMVQAIDHAITAGDVHYAADELEQRWVEFYSSGHATALLSFIDRLPEEAIVAHPVLALARAGVARSLGQMDEVEPWLQRAEQGAPDAPAPGWASTISAGAALSRSLYRLALGDVPGAITAARSGVELETDTGTPEYAIARYFLAMPLFYDDPAAAGPLLRDFLNAIPDGEQDVRRYYAMALLAEVNALDGDIDSASELASEAMQVARRQGLEEYPPTEQVYLALGLPLLAKRELDAAEERFERAVGLARRGGDKLEYAHALLWMARLRVLQDDPEGAADALRAAREVVPDLGQTAMGALVRRLALAPTGDRQPTAAAVIGDGEALTDAELRVLRLLPGDLTYREMAQQLYVSLNTVRTHALRVRRKLGASTRAEAVSEARTRGLL